MRVAIYVFSNFEAKKKTRGKNKEMKVLMATDGSEFSRAAIEKGCGQISLENAPAAVRIMAVAELMTGMAAEPFAISAGYIQETQAALLEQAEGFAAAAEEVVREKCGGSEIEITRKVTVGSPARAIVEEAEDWGADVIVVGSHGYGFWGRMVIGSVSQSVVNHAPCSVLVVRGRESHRNGKDKKD
jgi:nucleotide-binding universal stress UspA family protein